MRSLHDASVGILLFIVVAFQAYTVQFHPEGQAQGASFRSEPFLLYHQWDESTNENSITSSCTADLASCVSTPPDQVLGK